MIAKLSGFFPPGGIWIGATLTVVIPLLVYYVNRKLHEMGDPPWKNEEYRQKKQPK
ncbi:hypothetical protein [Bacillus suaedae]|uniref:Uncharacterized protein n=1 Tax=Halalkalibacter suaedae TaxID=2822140 RepID=A0A940WQ62_9BACI|nr:hypothetical protein [Bacillus suaedae]MBP3950495.1 hypothetical protein [Bacillus suaedae]